MGAGPIALNIRFDAVMFPGPDGKMRKLGTMVLGGPCEGPCSTRPRRAGMVVTPRERTTRAVCAGFIDPSTSPPVNQSTSPPVHPIHRLSQPRQRGTPSPPFPSRLLALVASALHRRGGHGGHPVTRPCRSTMKCAIPWAAVRSVSQLFSPPRCDAAPPRGCRRTRPVDRSPRSHRFHHCHWRGRPLP